MGPGFIAVFTCLALLYRHAAAGGPLWLSGVIYALMLSPRCHWNGTVARRRVAELEQRQFAAGFRVRWSS